MTSAAPFDNHLTIPGGITVTEVTVPDTQLCHYITDDELEHLGEAQRDPTKDIWLASLGTFAGAVFPAIDQLSRFNDPINPMGKVGLITCLLAAMALAITIITGFMWRRSAGRHKTLLDKIRARKRIPVKAE